jgi:hypothetical protein
MAKLFVERVFIRQKKFVKMHVAIRMVLPVPIVSA